MKSILDRSFRYTKAAETTPEYLRAKLKRIAKEMQSTAAANDKEREAKVKPMRKQT